MDPGKNRTKWFLIAGFWSFIALLSLSRSFFLSSTCPCNNAADAMFRHFFHWVLPNYGTWAVLTPFVFLVVGKVAFADRKWTSRVLRLLAVGLFVTLLHSISQEMIRSLIYPNPRQVTSFAHIITQHVPAQLPLKFILYSSIIGIGFAFDYKTLLRENQSKMIRLEEQLFQAKLDLSSNEQDFALLNSDRKEENRSEFDRFAIKEGREIILVKVEDVDYIEGEGVYVRLHVGSKSHLLRESLVTLENKLNPQRFFRIHRSTIVNLERIKKLIPQFHGDYVVVLQSGTQLRLSRTYREELQARFGSQL